MPEITKELIEIINTPGRVGVLATVSADGRPNIAYFGSPRMRDDGRLIMGLMDNRTLKNLRGNPNAVFLCVTGSPVSFETPGCRLHLKVEKLQDEGPVIDEVRAAVTKRSGEAAAKRIAAGVLFEVTEVRPLAGG